jgi:hypothetical protein
MRFWGLCKRNLKETYRDPMALGFLLGFPLLFMLLFGAIFSGANSELILLSPKVSVSRYPGVGKAKKPISL